MDQPASEVPRPKTKMPRLSVLVGFHVIPHIIPMNVSIELHSSKHPIYSTAAVSTKALAGAKSLGGFLYSAVNKAGKTVVEASVKIKKTVEENVSLIYVYVASGSMAILDQSHEKFAKGQGL